MENIILKTIKKTRLTKSERHFDRIFLENK